MKIKEKIDEYNKEINESNYYQSPDAMPVIKKLGETQWSKNKSTKKEAAKMMHQLAESNEYVAHKFLVEMDRHSTKVAEHLVNKYHSNLFTPKKKIKI